jgi:hypothetical protein
MIRKTKSYSIAKQVPNNEKEIGELRSLLLLGFLFLAIAASWILDGLFLKELCIGSFIFCTLLIVKKRSVDNVRIN